jgi:hypothetical protein
VETKCEIFEVGNAETLDESQWIGVLGNAGTLGYLGTSTLPVQAALNTGSNVTVQVWCVTQINDVTGGEVTASKGELSAVQTSSIS